MTVVLTCKHCGAVNRAESGTCCICDARLSQNTKDISVSAPVRHVTEGNLAVAPDWRSEVASRLKDYRARHNRPAMDPAQPELLFGDADEEVAPAEAEITKDAVAPPESGDASAGSDASAPAAEAKTPSVAQPPNARWHQAALPRPDAASAAPASAPLESAGTETKSSRAAAERPSLDRLEIDIRQPAFDFRSNSRTEDDRWEGEQRDRQRPWRESLESGIYPVASLTQRRQAAMLDAALVLFGYGAFLSLFVVLGGRFAFSKVDAAIAGSTLAVFYALYVALFTFFGGTTPGMMLRHLRVIGFDGSDPTPGQLIWRSFGYLVSAGTLMFGFLAALWDDDTLCWHDRISQTYLTSDSAGPLEP